MLSTRIKIIIVMMSKYESDEGRICAMLKIKRAHDSNEKKNEIEMT